MLRAGIVGYGSAGRGIHAPLLRAAGIEVAAVSTSSPARAEHARADHDGVQVVPDLDALLGLGGLDLVVVASPSGRHAENALAVIAAGLACVVDKPLAVHADAALEVVEAAARARVPLTVFQNRRYDAEHATLAHLVRSGALGEVYRAELRWERWRPVPKDRWRERAGAAEGGGILLDLHSHLVDAAVQLFGEVQTVYAEVAARTTTAEDDAFLACRHSSGVRSHLGATSVAGAPGPRVRVLGNAGAYLLNQFEAEPNIFSDLRDEHGWAGWLYRGPDREPVARQESSQVRFYEAVAAALRSDRPQAALPVDPRDAVHTLAVIDAARLSSEGQRVVEVVTPRPRRG